MCGCRGLGGIRSDCGVVANGYRDIFSFFEVMKCSKIV